MVNIAVSLVHPITSVPLVRLWLTVQHSSMLPTLLVTVNSVQTVKIVDKSVLLQLIAARVTIHKLWTTSVCLVLRVTIVLILIMLFPLSVLLILSQDSMPKTVALPAQLASTPLPVQMHAHQLHVVICVMLALHQLMLLILVLSPPAQMAKPLTGVRTVVTIVQLVSCAQLVMVMRHHGNILALAVATVLLVSRPNALKVLTTMLNVLLVQISVFSALLDTSVKRDLSISHLIHVLLVIIVQKEPTNQLHALPVLTTIIFMVFLLVTVKLVLWAMNAVKPPQTEVMSVVKDTTALLVLQFMSSHVPRVLMVVSEPESTTSANAYSAQLVTTVMKEQILLLLLNQDIGPP
mmetsp:Transcript_62220/g.85949  ORF Transcript_62220/g.85949 Transcript_62220/m.85949 type:complete len:349 (+) Transcript_62220:1727-2773(+)